MLSSVAPWLLLGSARLDEQATGAAPVEAGVDTAASAITPLRSLQLCEGLTLLPICNRSPSAQSLRLGRGDRITDVFAQVQHQIATSQITLKALPAGKESSSGCYGRLKCRKTQERLISRVCSLSVNQKWQCSRPRRHDNAAQGLRQRRDPSFDG